MKYGNLLIGFILLSAFWAGVANNVQAQDKTRISFWYTENTSEAPGVLSLVEAFEDENPDINVVEEAKGFFSAKETYLTAFSGGLEPTVFRAARDWVVEFAQQGLIQPVTSYLNDTDKEDFLEEALTLITYADANEVEQVWGWPHIVDAPALFYNKYLLDQAGVDTSLLTTDTSLTWENFTDIAQTVWDAELGSDEEPVYGFTFQGMFFGAQPIYYGHGARLFSNNNVSFDNIAIETAESVEGLEFVKDVVDAEYSPPWSEQGWETINTLFSNGRVGMIQQGPWELANFLTSSVEFNPAVDEAKSYAAESNLGIMRLPHDENGNEGAPLGGHAYAISKNAKGDVQEAAMKFGRFMSSYRANKEGAIDYYHAPVRASLYNDTDLQASGAWKYVNTFKQIIDRSVKNPVDPRWAQLETIFGNELDNYLAEEESLQEFFEFVKSFWGDILVESGGVYDPGGTDTETSPFNFIYFLSSFILVPIILRKKLR